MIIRTGRSIFERYAAFKFETSFKYTTVYQLAQLLPMEENFLLLFRFDNPLESSVEFMKVNKVRALELLV